MSELDPPIELRQGEPGSVIAPPAQRRAVARRDRCSCTWVDPVAVRHGHRVMVAMVAGYGLVGGLICLVLPPAELLPGLVGLAYGLLVLSSGIVMRRSGTARGPQVAFALVLAFAVPLYYWMAGRVTFHLGRPMLDAALLQIDAQILGRVLPDGQLWIWFDRSTLIGPNTAFGRVLVDVLTVSYLSFFVWGFGLLFILMGRVWRRQDATSRLHLRGYLCAWLGIYVVTYVLYVVVPAVGPAMLSTSPAIHGLDGVVLADPLRRLIRQFQVTPDCFPSGHFALSWITALYGLRVAPWWGRLALIAAIPITLSTLLLRYHYAVDLVAAIPVIWLGLWWGGLRRGTPRAGVRPAQTCASCERD